MGRLYLIGLGLGPRGIPVRGLELARSAKTVFLETYTARAADTPEALEGLIGRPVEAIGRADVEAGEPILEAARHGTTVLLVPGDALSATTHVALRMQAHAAGIPCQTVPAASIVSAAPAALGLSSYKFGRSTTLVFPRRSFAPDSPFEALAANRAAGLHTLVLLDISDDPELVRAGPDPSARTRCMTANEGLRWLLDAAARLGPDAFGPRALAGVVARAGEPDEAAFSGPAARLASADFGAPMHTLVVPGRLAPEEETALAALTRHAGQ